MKLRFLVDNRTEDSRCQAEWGLSILIETREKKILFDAGASPMFAENAQRLGVDLSLVDALVISHGHYDHTEGVPAFTERNEKAPIYLHKDALYETYGETDGVIDQEPCGIRWKQTYIDSIRDRLTFTEGIVPLYNNVSIVGNIPDYEDYPPTENFYRRVTSADALGQPQSKLEKDPMTHEQVLVVEEERGLFIFSGCGHRGVIPTIRYINDIFPEKKIVGLIAGMHLFPATAEERTKIVQAIGASDVEYVFPVHCTGIEGILELRNLLGKRCVVASCGHVYEF